MLRHEGADSKSVRHVRFADGKTMDVHELGANQALTEAETVESWMYSNEGVSFAFVKGAPVSMVASRAGTTKRDYFFTIQRSEAFDFDERILFLGVLLPLLSDLVPLPQRSQDASSFAHSSNGCGRRFTRESCSSARRIRQ